MFDLACNGYGFGYGGSFLLTVLFWFLLIVVSVWFITWLLPRLRTSTPTAANSALGSGSDTAIEILKRRYASGEISKAEYEAMRTDIEA
ncbi:MAG: SHOCT domain-containing protein [Chloroflexi bacterium]|nr:SHOCT domain-containing protein [Chloroflexota bacterium]